jgi:hypothetical protein
VFSSVFASARNTPYSSHPFLLEVLEFVGRFDPQVSSKIGPCPPPQLHSPPFATASPGLCSSPIRSIDGGETNVKHEIDRYSSFLEGLLSPSRWQHSLGVMRVMAELAEIYAVDD